MCSVHGIFYFFYIHRNVARFYSSHDVTRWNASVNEYALTRVNVESLDPISRLGVHEKIAWRKLPRQSRFPSPSGKGRGEGINSRGGFQTRLYAIVLGNWSRAAITKTQKRSTTRVVSMALARTCVIASCACLHDIRRNFRPTSVNLH